MLLGLATNIWRRRMKIYMINEGLDWCPESVRGVFAVAALWLVSVVGNKFGRYYFAEIERKDAM